MALIVRALVTVGEAIIRHVGDPTGVARRSSTRSLQRGACQFARNAT